MLLDNFKPLTFALKTSKIDFNIPFQVFTHPTHFMLNYASWIIYCSQYDLYFNAFFFCLYH